jgi:hypothetical protein
MGSMEELEGRVSALEGQMRYVREDAAAARVLAGGADRDVSAFGARLDAHQRLLEALRETQVEQGQRISGLETEVRRGFASIEDRLGRRLDGVEGRLGGIDGRLDGVEGRLGGIDGRLAGLEGGQALILDLLRRRNGHEEDPPASAE